MSDSELDIATGHHFPHNIAAPPIGRPFVGARYFARAFLGAFCRDLRVENLELLSSYGQDVDIEKAMAWQATRYNDSCGSFL